MSYGKMKGFALIKQLYKQKDADGFTKDAELILAGKPFHLYSGDRYVPFPCDSKRNSDA